MNTFNSIKKPNKIIKRSQTFKRSSNIFYCAMFALPLLQFAVFYIGVNFNSVLLAFEQTLNIDNVYVTEFVGLNTFQRFITECLTTEIYSIAIWNSVKYLLFSLIVVIPLGLIFSFYIYRKNKFASLFKTFLFLPSVICSLIMVIFFSYIADRVYPQIVQSLTGNRPAGLLTTPDTSFLTIAFFTFFFSFGPSTLIYLNAMNQIPVSVVEAFEIDGASGLSQFVKIVLPLIFPSISSYIIICISQVATNQLSGYSFYKGGASDKGAQTIGYMLFEMLTRGNEELYYPLASAGGILFTLVVAPVTLIIRYLLDKFGPSEN